MKKEKEVNVTEAEETKEESDFFEEVDQEAEQEQKKAKKKGSKKKVAIIIGTVAGCIAAGLIGVGVMKATQKKKAAGLNVIDGNDQTTEENKIEEQTTTDIPEAFQDETTNDLMNAAKML